MDTFYSLNRQFVSIRLFEMYGEALTCGFLAPCVYWTFLPTIFRFCLSRAL